MTISIEGRIYYRTTEACRKAGISRTTLFRWINEGLIECGSIRDRNGWRLFTSEDIESIRSAITRPGISNGKQLTSEQVDIDRIFGLPQCKHLSHIAQL